MNKANFSNSFVASSHLMTIDKRMTEFANLSHNSGSVSREKKNGQERQNISRNPEGTELNIRSFHRNKLEDNLWTT